MPVADLSRMLGTFRIVVHDETGIDDPASFGVSTPLIGHYYLASPGVTRPWKPYAQIGQRIEEGQPLCRIHVSGIRMRARDYLLCAPRVGVLTERTAELKRSKRHGEIIEIQDGFPVLTDEILFTMKLID